jgi:hypothetical protein
MGASRRGSQMRIAIPIVAGLAGATVFLLIVLIIAIVRLPVVMILKYRRGRIIKNRLVGYQQTEVL